MHSESAGLNDTTMDSRMVTLVLPPSPHSPSSSSRLAPLSRSGDDDRRGIVAIGAGFLLTCPSPLALTVDIKKIYRNRAVAFISDTFTLPDKRHHPLLEEILKEKSVILILFYHQQIL